MKIRLSSILVCTVVASLSQMTSSIGAQVLQPDEPAVISTGEKIYLDNCAACHGANLEGEANWRTPDEEGFMRAPPHDESGHTWHHSERLLFDLTKYGIGGATGLKDHKTRMPIYDGILSDEEIIAVLSYIKSRWPPDLQRRHTEMSEQDR